MSPDAETCEQVPAPVTLVVQDTRQGQVVQDFGDEEE